MSVVLREIEASQEIQQAFRRRPPEDQAAPPLIEVAEMLETETDTFEAALRYDAAHGAGHPGLTHFYSVERA